MPDQPKYDVAISFLMQDMDLARSLHLKLKENLSVFFFERKQEELAGREGLEVFREPFQQARVSVVLYRPPWGEGGWTGVERVAIGEECQKRGYLNLFMVQMDGKSKMPAWVPTTHIYFNIAEFPFDELVGAIKLKVIELGGRLEPMTAEKRATMHVAEQEYQTYRQRLWSTSDGIGLMQKEIAVTFTEIDRKCADLTAKGINIRSGSDPGRCVITNETVSVVVYWKRSGYPNIEHDELVIEEYDWYIALPAEPRRRYYEGEPRPSITTSYKLEITRAREAIWKASNGRDLMSAAALADKVVIIFFELAERVTAERNRRYFAP